MTSMIHVVFTPEKQIGNSFRGSSDYLFSIARIDSTEYRRKSTSSKEAFITVLSKTRVPHTFHLRVGHPLRVVRRPAAKLIQNALTFEKSQEDPIPFLALLLILQRSARRMDQSLQSLQWLNR